MTETGIVALRERTEGLSTEPYADAFRERLPDRAVTLARTPKQERELVVDARVVMGITIGEDLLDRADRPELFACMFVGIDHVPVDALADHDVAITNADGIHAPGIVEQTIGNMLVFARRLHRGWWRKEHAEWRHFQLGEFTDSMVTIIGLSFIGQTVAQCLQGFEVETTGIHYTPSKGGPTDEVADFDSDAIHDALPRSDYVVVACPLNDLTRRPTGDAEFATTSTGAVLVNAARGGIVDTDVLVSTLRSNETRGAALDVTDPEPLPADHPLWGLENCLITPHTGSHTPKHRDRPVDVVAGSLGWLDEGEELENQVLAAESNWLPMAAQERPDDSSDGQRTDLSADPGDNPRADYDYVGGGADREALVCDLERLVDGDVRFDEYTRQLYATDASAYEVLPAGAVIPTSTADMAAVVEYYADREIPVLPRGGGTSLVGQVVNEAIVLDLSRHMDGVQSADSEAATVTAQTGVTLTDLDNSVTDHGLTFGPDPAVGDRNVLGGAIGNNSTGAYFLKYGETDYYVEKCEVVLADGSVHRLDEMRVAKLREKADPESDAQGSDGSQDPLLPRTYVEVVHALDEERAEINARYPDLKRNVSGYNLDALVEEAHGERLLADGTGTDPDCRSGAVNLARLLAGSEGSLAVMTEMTVSLEPLPEAKTVTPLIYEDVFSATTGVAPIFDHDPAAVELIDDVLIDLALNTAEFYDVAVSLPDGTRAALLVEFYADSDVDGRRRVADLLMARAPSVTPEVTPSLGVDIDDDARAFDVLETHDEAAHAGLWKMRKTAVPILLSRMTDKKHISFIEDCAVPADELPGYAEHFREVIDDHGANTSFYAHAGPGVLHVRPLVNTKTFDGLGSFETAADEVTDFVVGAGGSVSGEHDDSRARTQWNRKLYSDCLWNAFRDLRTMFDPGWILNPGRVCGDVSMTEDLRFDPDYEFDAGFDPEPEWDTENGFQGMAELCHGYGSCRGD